MTTIKTLDGSSITINGAEDIAKLTREELLDVTLRFIMENNRMEKCYLNEMLEWTLTSIQIYSIRES